MTPTTTTRLLIYSLVVISPNGYTSLPLSPLSRDPVAEKKPREENERYLNFGEEKNGEDREALGVQ